jgi:hypothetical protein
MPVPYRRVRSRSRTYQRAACGAGGLAAVPGVLRVLYGPTGFRTGTRFHAGPGFQIFVIRI